MFKVMALFAIPMLIILFKKSNFGEGRIQKAISYVGTHTLEIYVLQYFFLPLSYKLDNSIVGGKLLSYVVGREHVNDCLMRCRYKNDRF